MPGDQPAAGRRHRWIVAIGMSLVAVGLALAFFLQERPEGGIPLGEGIWAFVLEELVSHLIAGAIIGLLLSGLFGRSGAFGWVLALIGGVFATLLSGALGGVLGGLPRILTGGADLVGEIIDLAAGLLVGPMAMAGALWIAPLWVIAICIVHALARSGRA